MGHKRRAGPAFLLLLLCVSFLRDASGHREVGCLFSKNLCKPEIETCYNDLAFGRCLLVDDNLSEEDLYQYDLEPEELELLRLQLERLEYEGYKWSHDYTQCVIQILLDDLRYRTSNDVEALCKSLKMRPEGRVFDGDNRFAEERTRGSEGDPVAIVKFAPSNPHREYADEFYYPSDMRERMEQERRDANGFDDYDEGFYEKLASAATPDEVYRRGSRSLSKKSYEASARLPYLNENYEIPREYVEAVRDIFDSKASQYDDADSDDLEFLPSDKKPIKIDIEEDEYNDDNYAKTFSRKYKYPSQLDGVDFLDESDDESNDYDENDDDDNGGDDDDDDINNEKIIKPLIDSLAQQSSGMYAEGGTIVPIRRDGMRPDEYEDMSLNDDMLWSRDMAGFKRRERLDVKKPGPPFSTNNYAFKTQSPPTSDDEDSNEDSHENDVLYMPVKKETHNSNFGGSQKIYENVDLDHVYIQFNEEFHSWAQGDKVVNTVEKLLGLQPGELKDIRVGRAEVTFKVPRNTKEYNATDIVSKIDDIRSDLHDQLNIGVVRAGIGDKAKMPAMLEVTQEESSSTLFGALVAVSVAAVSAAAIVLLVIARHHAKSRAKLANLRTPDPEASKDYQELCRARMQAKQSDRLSESPKAFDFGRLIESGKSESNRSSTSSWAEEPQTTCMDVATGHAVLAYMEEHLKNQDKLNEEWATLCAYEAEPCSTAIAEAEGNAECNRSGAALPYDHSRVVLNDLTNLNNSDYVNASTITDHDPRNPAYIATQGPLPQTTADFWQLVWEQGSVVIVMLTRLTEEGQAMCHRYWPDEGSELYHIYEVHLVSEHIWCDDYLVRSFYLKNLRTGETRTVTQFHFLSWPNNGVPKSTKTLLEFRRKVNKSYRGRSCPIIVHCSDGAGRTGTYCLIDMVLNRMSKGAKEIDIAATLEHIRDQRSEMVATKQQFEFALMSVAEELHSILKSLPNIVEKSPAKEKQAPVASGSKSDK